MLADGDIPAMISPTLPRAFVQGDKRIARLFADYKNVEIEYFRQTGIFPIMHVTTVKQGHCRQISMGADQSGQGIRGVQAARLQARRQSAHGAAGFRAHRGRGGRRRSLARTLVLRADSAEPQELGDGAALRPPAGPGSRRSCRSMRCSPTPISATPPGPRNSDGAGVAPEPGHDF